ncbi:hypothetical protein CspeluHIS016_0303630 [Cutaneotrichosporon spelunceum]|uniref:BAG domain-containing protein n=1 Tax=Cutaneotrichosporon spelunceum TaxID=1672016 RepID=A0AAD3TTW5_9TREE|nr:hypothetical protein CspeluHIS016_0303630 [Cutaneotrichosporon spelunceum]
MSFYGHPYVITPQGYYYAHPQRAQQQQQQVQHPGNDLALEERQAMAYLQSVRRRREAAEAAMALEAQERQRAQVEREKALRAAEERHNALIQAARRERAIREALERERQREAAFQQALQQHQAQQVQASIEAERRRQTQAAEAYARALAEHRERAAPRQPQTSAAPPSQTKDATEPEKEQNEDDSGVDLDGINALLGQLFGFNIATEPTLEPPAPKPMKEEEPKKVEAKPETPKAVTPAPATPKETSKDVAPKEDRENDDGIQLPEPLNVLLNQFLGFDVGPAAEGERGNPKAPQQLVGNAVGDLNSFLSQYGLEFVPDSDSEDEDEAPTTEAPKIEPPKLPLTSEGGWAQLPSENDKNAKAKAEAPKAVEGSKAETKAAEASKDDDPRPSAATMAALGLPVAPAVPATPKKEERPRQAAREPDEDAPFTSTLGSYQNLPPFLRDILSQMEAAMCDEHSDCSCDTTTHTPCAHGWNGGPCVTHRQQKRRERAIAKKRATKERRDARRSKKHASGQESVDEAGIPYGASADDAVVHHDVYAQAAAAGEAGEKDIAQANLKAEEERQAAIPKGEPQEVVDLHRSAADDAAVVGKDHGLHETKPAPKDDAPEAAGQHSQLHADAPAFHPKSESKGKEKAKKSAKPTSPQAVESLQKLDAISKQLHDTCEKFEFPRHLSFAPSLTDASQPPLLYTRNNHAYHHQAHSLMQLLLAVDGVQSHGDKSVRHRRKEVVQEVEGALNRLEKGRDEKWQEVKARRERGESDDDDGWVLTGDSTDMTSDTEA